MHVNTKKSLDHDREHLLWDGNTVGFFIYLKFIFSKKATKIDEIFTVDLTLYSKCQIEGEDFVDFVAFLENTNFK